MTLAIYAIADASDWGPHVHIALRDLKLHADCLIIAGDIGGLASQLAALAPDQRPDRVHEAPGLAAAIRAGMSARKDQEAVVLTGAHALGAMGIEAMLRSCPNDGVIAAYPIRDAGDTVQVGGQNAPQFPCLDFAVLGAQFTCSAHTAFTDGPDGVDTPRSPERSLQRVVDAQNAPLKFVADVPDGGPLPGLSDPVRVLQAGAPCVSAQLAKMDPGFADVMAVGVQRVFAELLDRSPDLHRAAKALLRSRSEPRAACVLAGDYAVIPTEDQQPKSSPKVAALLHIWYPEAADELLDLVDTIAAQTDLFISTGSKSAKARIDANLEQRGLTADVRIVDHNRGRDMSSLFITFSDVALGGHYDVCLRLHSKRTPQMPAQVSRAFKDHLFGNLVASRGYTARILDRFMDDPDLGLIMPPAVHNGFGTLGHGWFGNKAPLRKWAKKLGLVGPIDDLTPLAPFGTMYWFRPAALKKMFAYPWRWTDYNAEPHHVDGGLAHIQERLIAYAVLDAGFEVLQVMTPENAAMNYARLEWKYQALAGRLSSPSFVEQEREIRFLANHPRVTLRRRMRQVFGKLMIVSPSAGKTLHPLARRIFNLLAIR